MSTDHLTQVSSRSQDLSTSYQLGESPPLVATSRVARASLHPLPSSHTFSPISLWEVRPIEDGGYKRGATRTSADRLEGAVSVGSQSLEQPQREEGRVALSSSSLQPPPPCDGAPCRCDPRGALSSALLPIQYSPDALRSGESAAVATRIAQLLQRVSDLEEHNHSLQSQVRALETQSAADRAILAHYAHISEQMVRHIKGVDEKLEEVRTFAGFTHHTLQRHLHGDPNFQQS